MADLKALLDSLLDKPFDPLNQYAKMGLNAPLRVGDMAALGVDMLPGIGDVKSAAQGVDALKQGDLTKGALGLAGALPFVGGAGIFVGPKALGANRLADIPELVRARNLLSKGKLPAEVWQRTGWSNMPDGFWRTELDDSAAQLDVDKLLNHNTKHALFSYDVLKHPDLFGTNYDELPYMMITPREAKDMPYNGEHSSAIFDPESSEMFVNKKYLRSESDLSLKQYCMSYSIMRKIRKAGHLVLALTILRSS